MESNITFKFQDLPCTVKGFTLQHNDFYTIVLNSRLNLEQNIRTAKHELTHISNGDFDSTEAVQALELMCHETIQIH